jgi:predicted TPR repeat methyltransferase
MYYDFHYKAKLTSFGRWMVIKVNETIVRKIVSLFQPGSGIKLCEIGHDRGLFADIFRSNFKDRLNYFGIEPNGALFKAGTEKGYTLKQQKIPPFPDDKDWKDFDCIYVAHVLEHLPNAATVCEVLSTFNAKLKPDGYLVVLFPDYLDYKDDYYTVDYSHEYLFTERRMRQLAGDTGFEIVSMKSFRSCFPRPYSFIIYPMHLAIKVITGQLLKLFSSMDFLFKLKITFGRNVLVICRKK